MTREQYAKLYRMYFRMSDRMLSDCLTELASKRYIDNNIDVYAEHRIAARVQLERKRSGESLIFHMKNLHVREK